MSLPFSDPAMNTVSGLLFLIPVILGIWSCFDSSKKERIILLFASALIGWLCVNGMNLISNWNLDYKVQIIQARGETVSDDLMLRYTSDGASNVFALIFGWIPSVTLFGLTLGIVLLIKKIITKTNREQSVVPNP